MTTESQCRTAVAVDEVLITPELDRRPARVPDYAAENRALVALAGTVADTPERVFQALADWALTLCKAGSAGVSVWEPGVENVFRWRATAGDYAQYRGGTLPRHFSPCGTVLDRNGCLLMADPIRAFPYIAELCSPVREVLLVPFYQAGVPVGTVWVVAHESDAHFDAEDARLVTSLSKFAGAAVMTLTRMEAAERAEVKQGEREEHLRALVNATSDVVYRMSADWQEMQPLDGRGLLASTSAPERGWLAKNVPEFEHARVKAAIACAIAEKQTFELEHQVIGPDGQLGWTFSRAIPVLEADGTIREWLGAASDITLQKRAEERLREVGARSESRKRLYETALSNTPDLIYVFDLDHRFTFANEALLTLWGKTWDEAIGKTCRELGYEEWHAAMHDREIEQVRATKRPVRGEVPFGGFVGGERRIYDYILAPVFSASGDVEAVAGTTRDVTERQTMEQDLREADRQKDDFIAMLAHELRNPLAPIATGLSLIDDSADAVLRQKALGVMQRQVHHMVRLIDDLLDVSRITRGKLTLRRERVSLTSIVEAAIEGSLLNIERGKHTLVKSLTDEPIVFDADQTRLAQVISNLLDNASKYTPAGGNVQISTHRDGGEACIAIRDTGLGIPSDQLENVFEMFSQVNRALDRSQGGLGIGLALVRKLVAMHGGSVTAASEGPGKGSTFTVRLPFVESLPVQPQRENELPALQPGTSILVVDDNDDAAELLKLTLDGAGYPTTTALDGPSAIVVAETAVPRVVFLDIGLPGMSGYDVARQLRTDPRFDTTVLIALTGWGTHEDQRKASAAGFDMHLTKPVSTHELRQALNRAATLRQGP